MTAFINRIKPKACIRKIKTFSIKLVANLQRLSLFKIISQIKPSISSVVPPPPPPPPQGIVYVSTELVPFVSNSSASDEIVPILDVPINFTQSPTGDYDHRLTIISSSSPSFSLPQYVLQLVHHALMNVPTNGEVKQYYLLVFNNVNLNTPNTYGLAPSLTVFQKSDLGKTIFGVVVPVTMGLLALIYNHSKSFPVGIVVFVACTLSLGSAFIWDGILLRDNFPWFSGALEEIGVALVFLAFFALVTSILPLYLIWAPGLCYLLILLPPIVLRFHGGRMQGM